MPADPELTLIAGAGLGGLAAAGCLLNRDFQVSVHEQAAELAEIGAGIQLSANAVRALFDPGLREALESVAVRPLAYEFRCHDTAELLQRMPLNAAAGRWRGRWRPVAGRSRRDSLDRSCPADR